MSSLRNAQLCQTPWSLFSSSSYFFSGIILSPRPEHTIPLLYRVGCFSVSWKSRGLPLCVQQILSPKNIHFTGRCPIQTNNRAGKGIKNYSLLYSNWKQQSRAVPDISAFCCTWFVLVMRLQPLLTIHSGHSPAGLIIALEWLWLSDMQRRHVWPVLLCRTNALLTVCNIV